VRRPLSVSRQTTFPGVADADTNFRARVSVGPDVYGTTWIVNRIAVSSDAPVPTQAFFYRNQETATAQRDATYSGNSDSDDTDLTLQIGERIIIVWVLPSGLADPTIYNCYLTVEGDQDDVRG
jgi:hypothetical protein